MINTPVGDLKIVVNDQALVAILWDQEKPNRVPLPAQIESKNDPLILETEKQLNEYFQGQRKAFSLPLELRGTPFQAQVWERLKQIPYGTTLSYKTIASQIGKPDAVRAVGTAIGRNPISIIIPCHRVIGRKGSLTGFAGGLPRKKFLLMLEESL